MKEHLDRFFQDYSGAVKCGLSGCLRDDPHVIIKRKNAFCGPEGNRTPDLLIANETFYH